MEKLHSLIHDADRLKTALLAFVLLSSVTLIQPAAAVPGSINNGEIEQLVPRLMEQADIPGMSVVVLRHGRVSYFGNFGVMDRRSDEPVSRRTTFFAASLSKPMFAYAVLRLAQRGEISLDRPLAEYLPNPRLAHDPRYREITARMVLSHQSGLPNWSDTERMELSFDPGSAWEYSGEGSIYLPQVVEKLSGLDLNEFMQTEVFRPLGMDNSAFYASDELRRMMATGHDLLGRPTERPQPTKSSMNPAGTLITSGEDYGRFIEAFINRRGLDAKLSGGMSTAQVRPGGFFGGESDLPVYWGLGFGIETTENGNTVWQWGDNLDYRNFVMVNPQQGSGIILLSNSENGLSVTRRLCEQVLEGPHPALDWLPFAQFDDPRFVARMKLEHDYVENGGHRAAGLYAEARRNLDSTQLQDLVVSVGKHLVRDGQPQAAISLLELHADSNADRPEAQDLLASFYLSAGNSRQALAVLQKSASLEPDNPERNRTISRIQRQL